MNIYANTTDQIGQVIKNDRTYNVYHNTCTQCNKVFDTTVLKTKTCSTECHKLANPTQKYEQIEKNCIQCGEKFTKARHAKFCSGKCGNNARLAKQNAGTIGIDYIACPICNAHLKQISAKHARMHGYSSPLEMGKILQCETTCQTKKDCHSGENNPAFNHGGKLSPWSKNFIHGYDEEAHNMQKKSQSDYVNANRHLYKNTIEYWLLKTDGDMDEAKKLLSKSQTRDLSWFIQTFGEVEGPIRHKQKTEKWMKNFKKQNYSNISQILFDLIMDQLPPELKKSVYYATHNISEEDLSLGKNNEYRLETEKSFIKPDFIILDKKKIIEFDGTYWHSAAVLNIEKEQQRDNQIISLGYEVYHVPEKEFNINRDKVVQNCLAFLISDTK